MILRYPNDVESIERCFKGLFVGNIFVYPTETVYALGCSSFDPKAITKIYNLKSRDIKMPLLVLASNWAMLKQILAPINKRTYNFLNHFWPGPLTAVLPSKHPMQQFLNPNKSTIGVRITSSPAAIRLIDAVGRPLVGTSANISGIPPSTTVDSAREIFKTWVNYYVDAGESYVSHVSTVVDLCGRKPVILRRGMITADQILNTWYSSK